MPLSGVRCSVVVNGKWGDAEVNAGHRRQQTGSNWREPVSLSPPTTASRWRGSWRTGKKRGRKRRRETLLRRDTVHANKFRTPYIARGRVSILTSESIQTRPGRNKARYRAIVLLDIGTCQPPPSNLTAEHVLHLCFTSDMVILRIICAIACDICQPMPSSPPAPKKCVIRFSCLGLGIDIPSSSHTQPWIIREESGWACNRLVASCVREPVPVVFNLLSPEAFQNSAMLSERRFLQRHLVLSADSFS